MKYYIRKNSSDKSIYQATVEKDGKIDVFPQGGGFSRSMTEAAFTEKFVEVTGVFPIARATVTANFLPDEMVLECIGSERRWNGWGIPMFERHVVETLISVRVDERDNRLMSWDGDTLLIVNREFNPKKPESDENYKFDRHEPEQVEIENQMITVWKVGEGWSWDGLRFGKAPPR